jgi:divalent metal cation (Fe/Co/Zn/Cd) transporter
VSATRLQRGLRATFLGLAVNSIRAAGKILAGVAGHSHARIAEGVESLADLFNSLIVWRGLVVAATPADADHPYGHGKAEPIAAGVVATLLLVAALAAAGIIAWNGWRLLRRALAERMEASPEAGFTAQVRAAMPAVADVLVHIEPAASAST